MRTAKSRALFASIVLISSAPAAGALAQSVQLEQVAFVERASHDGVDRAGRHDAAVFDIRKDAAHRAGGETVKGQAHHPAGPR
ncbi:MAG TPA: hypothetical protein VHY32_09370 [Caulobacteraceae bacterium]|nr:hypothetical protein [Caulobacteraceae bacterium]